MTTDDDERWLAAITGGGSPRDLETRRAALLGSILREERRADDAGDPAATIRILNTLRARGAFETAAAPGRRTFAGAFLSWVRATGTPLRLTAVAAAALAVVAVPVLYREPARAPSEAADGIKAAPGQRIEPAVPVVVDDVESAANALDAALGRHGVGSERLPVPGGIEVTAQVPPERRAAAAADLQALGLRLPSSGKVDIAFRRRP